MMPRSNCQLLEPACRLSPACLALLALVMLCAGAHGQTAERKENYPQVMLPSAIFTNTTAKGKTKMFEFSGIAAVGNKLIVVDNETGQLGNNNAGISDHFDQAVFE